MISTLNSLIKTKHFQPMWGSPMCCTTVTFLVTSVFPYPKLWLLKAIVPKAFETIVSIHDVTCKEPYTYTPRSLCTTTISTSFPFTVKILPWFYSAELNISHLSKPHEPFFNPLTQLNKSLMNVLITIFSIHHRDTEADTIRTRGITSAAYAQLFPQLFSLDGQVLNIERTEEVDSCTL